MTTFVIETPRGKREIGDKKPCFVIAEVSANHQQDLEKAKELVRIAASSGADAVKLQTYLPETMTLDSRNEVFLVKGEVTPGNWQNQSLFELYQKAFTPWEWHGELQELAHSLGIAFFSTPFDHSSVEFLETLNVPLYKIASYEMTDIPLLRSVASTGKPVIMSVGFASLAEIDLSVKTLRDAGCKDLALLYCATNYSSQPHDSECNLETMNDLKTRYSCTVGFSDNTGGVSVPVQAAIMGASVIEKHIALDDKDSALDGVFSLDRSELKTMISEIRLAELRRGVAFYGPRNEGEAYFKRFRRSIFASRLIAKGESFGPDNIRVVRPSDGLEPKYFDELIGRKAARDIPLAAPVNWDDVSKE